MKMLKSVLTLSVLMAFASASALADGVQTRDEQPGYARADGGTRAYFGIGEKTGVPLPGAAFSTEALDSADFPGDAQGEPGFGKWSSSKAGKVQPGKGAPWSGDRPR